MKFDLAKIGNAATRLAGRPGFILKKHSPEILIGLGVVGFVGTVISACVATTKIDDVLDEGEEKKYKIINKYAESEKLFENEGQEVEIPLTKKDQRELAKVQIETGLDIVKLYAPSVIFGVASLGCILGSHGIMSKRNAGLSAAYMAADKAFKEYRTRVQDKIGEDKEQELYLGGETVKDYEYETDEETGKEKKVKKDYSVISDPSQVSEYARFFDETCGEWTKSPEYNKKWLLIQQGIANDKLAAQGHLFLNEVYDLLGMKRSTAGQIVGWIYDPAKGEGDGFVDFGIFDVRVPAKRDFVNGYEPSILLDFNVDGPIYDLL